MKASLEELAALIKKTREASEIYPKESAVVYRTIRGWFYYDTYAKRRRKGGVRDPSEDEVKNGFHQA